MKRMLANLLAGVVAASASAGVVSIKFQGERPDTMVYNAISYAERVNGITSVDWRRVALTSDSVVIKVDDTELMELTAWPLDVESNNLFVLVGPGEAVDATVRDGNMRKASLRGTPFLESLADYFKARDEFEASEGYTALDRSDRIMAHYKFSLGYARAHRGEDIGLWALQYLPLAMVVSAVDSIPENVREGRLQSLYEVMAGRVENFKTDLERKSRNEQHGMAPDFTLQTEEGDTVTLSRLRGRWVLLDFWATWCKWCIKGFPELKSFADEYRGRCEVIGVSTDDHREIWLEYLKSHPSNHTELWADATDKSDANPKRSYAIDALPTKFLIAPDGHIALYEVGENPEFLERVKAIIEGED